VEVVEQRSPSQPQLLENEFSMEAEEYGVEEVAHSHTTINSINFDSRKSQEAFGHLVPKTKAQKEREKEILESILTQKPIVEIFEVRSDHTKPIK
jgi:hypothetical protein